MGGREMKKERSIVQIVVETESEEINRLFSQPLYVSRYVLIDGEEVYSDRMDAQMYDKRTDPIRECLKFLNGQPTEYQELTEKLKKQIREAISSAAKGFDLDVPGDEELKALRHFKDTSVGLWCIDRNPNEVSMEWIRKHAFRLEFGEHGEEQITGKKE